MFFICPHPFQTSNGLLHMIREGFEERVLQAMWGGRTDLALFEVEQALWFEATLNLRDTNNELGTIEVGFSSFELLNGSNI
jgi:hypothetical protein